MKKMTSCCFDDKMKQVLKENRVNLVSNLQPDDVLDHLIKEKVFDCVDYIKAEKTRKDQVRKLLDDLQKRPARDFHKFITVLRNTHQGHLADTLDRQYKELSGFIPQQHCQRFTDHDRSDGPEDAVTTSACYEWSNGRVLAVPVDDSCDRPAEVPHRSLTVYAQKKEELPMKIYPMESSPRGLALIIDNEHFENPAVGDRVGTEEDSEALRSLLQDVLNFDVHMQKDCTAEQIKVALQNLATRLSSPENPVDACVVAVLSHGRINEQILGTDGEIITTLQMRRYFGVGNCPAMAGKPKLFIIQACKGVTEDTVRGPRQVRVDVEIEPNSPQEEGAIRLPDTADVCFLYATVEGFVAYRNIFIPKLCHVFRENAGKFHVKEIASLLNHEMANERIEGDRLTMSEDRGSLTKLWYLNPPHAASPY